MLVASVALSTPLLAQLDEPPAPPPRAAIGFGFVASLGPSWQFEGGELAFVRLFRGGGIGAVSFGARVGTFVDEAQILGGTRGIIFAPTLAARSATASIAQLGDDVNATNIGFDVTLEASGYLASSSPFPEGSRWLGLALLPGLRVGTGDGPRYALVVGPTAFLSSHKPSVRGLFALRIEAPLARRERRP